MADGPVPAVVVDATVVRSLLLPSVMKSLGDRAWFMPSALD
jgi:uncharacterized membrane protein YdfJ with MMPL/SSD domain